MRLIIAGGRDFNDPDILCEKLDAILANNKPDVILSGAAAGADTMGEGYAENHGIPLELYPADWDNDGKRAGFIRNAKMAENATHLVAFWDGYSSGTKHMLKIAKQKGLKIRVVFYEKVLNAKIIDNSELERLLCR